VLFLAIVLYSIGLLYEIKNNNAEENYLV